MDCNALSLLSPTWNFMKVFRDTFMTSSIENASLTLVVPVTLIFSGFSLNRFYMLASVFTLVLTVSGLLRGAPFGSSPPQLPPCSLVTGGAWWGFTKRSWVSLFEAVLSFVPFAGIFSKVWSLPWSESHSLGLKLVSMWAAAGVEQDPEPPSPAFHPSLAAWAPVSRAALC